MKQREIWDAYDANGNLLGFDLYRDEAEQIPAGIYHAVADVITVTKDKKVLITQRDPGKRFGLEWEFTGGSVLKGETPLQGAVRELREETGILQEAENLTMLSRTALGNSLYHIYVHTVESSGISVTLQEGETVAYRFIPVSDLKAAVEEERLCLPVRERFATYEKALFNYIGLMEK